jgi:hypothetical protein
MTRYVPITPEKKEIIAAALEKDPHASRVARTLGDVSYATVWRVADRNNIALTAGRETMGHPRLPAEAVEANRDRGGGEPGGNAASAGAQNRGQPRDGRPGGARPSGRCHFGGMTRCGKSCRSTRPALDGTFFFS